MDWPEEFAESFPPARDDEPMSLRQDIVDELADHLESALHRQLITTQDEHSARAKVFDRFGDPQRLARQLWLDAMQEKIMSQRVSLAVTALLCTICLFAVGMMWRFMEQAQAATRELAEETRATNRLLMERLTHLSVQTPGRGAATTETRSPDWNPVMARLVLGEKDGPPAEGFIVRLSKKDSKTGLTNFETIAEERTGPGGIADLAVVPPGKYVLSAMRSGDGEFFSTQVNVLPGSIQTVEIICPPEKIKKVDAVIRFDIPEDLRQKDLYVTAEMVLGPRDFSGSEWRTGFNGAEANDSLAIFVIAPDGRVGLTYQGIMSHTTNGEPIQMLPSAASGQGFAQPEERPLVVFKTNYYLRTIRIGRATPIYDVASGQSNSSSLMAVKSEWHYLPENKRIYPGTFLDYRIATRNLALLQRFNATVGQKNEWRISVPDEFWEKARKDLDRADRIAKEKSTTPVGNAYAAPQAQ